MITAATTSSDLAVFVSLVSKYFSTVSGISPVHEAASIELNLPELYACTGFISVGGPLVGWIAVSFRTILLDRLLEALNEDIRNDMTRLDLAGEIASTVAANAREHFGQRLSVSPPLMTGDRSLASTLKLPSMVFKLPFTWSEQQGQMLVAIN